MQKKQANSVIVPSSCRCGKYGIPARGWIPQGHSYRDCDTFRSKPKKHGKQEVNNIGNRGDTSAKARRETKGEEAVDPERIGNSPFGSGDATAFDFGESRKRGQIFKQFIKGKRL